MKKAICLLAALLLLLSSCKSKKNLVPPIARPVLNIDSIRPDSSGVVARLFVSDTPGLRKPSARRKAAEKGQVTPPGITCSISPVVARGANITSSAISVSSVYPGIDRVRRYEFTHRDVPEAFDGFRIALISDLHYKSLFKKKGLESLVRLLSAQHVDVLLTGGDYQEGCQFVPEFLTASTKVKIPLGTYGVIGNNDHERCHDEVVRGMKCYGMRLFEYQLDTLRRNSEQIILAGVRNPFDLANNGASPTLSLSPADFVIPLVRTPNYAEDVFITSSDLVLAGHMHGEQIHIFGYAPTTPSYYGDRFLTGLEYNSVKTPMTVTNGIGTLNKNICIRAPAEIVMVTLYCLQNE